MNPEESRLTGVYPTAWQWVKDYYPDTARERYREYPLPPTVFSQQPKTIEKEIHWKFLHAASTVPPPAFVVNLENGRIVSYNGAVISPTNHLLWDVSVEFIAPGPEQHFLLTESALPLLQTSGENVAALTFCASQYYYHWLFDVLPRLHLLGKMDTAVDKYAINWNGRPAFQKETLELLGMDQGKIITVTEETNLEVKNLYVPSLPGYTGHMGKWTVDFLRKELMGTALKKTQSGRTPKRIYISRAGAGTRTVINEEELSSMLKHYQFTTVNLENMSVVDQIRLFHDAEVIIGAHGGGLTNIAFCQHGTKVLELFSPNYVHTCYFILAQHVKADYHYLLGTGERPPDYVDPNAVHRDIHVDLREVKKMLKKMKLKRSS